MPWRSICSTRNCCGVSVASRLTISARSALSSSAGRRVIVFGHIDRALHDRADGAGQIALAHRLRDEAGRAVGQRLGDDRGSSWPETMTTGRRG